MMKKILFGIFLLGLLNQCADDPLVDPTGTLTISNINLPQIDDAYEYRAWLLLSGTFVYLEDFTFSEFNEDQAIEVTNINTFDLEAADAVAITVNAKSSSNSPGDFVLLVGNFEGNTAELLSDFETAGGVQTLQNGAQVQYTIQSPTTPDVDADENSGVWLFSSTDTDSTALANLKFTGVEYEPFLHFQNADGTADFSLGVMTSANATDKSNVYTTGSTANIPPFPGEDFLTNASGNTVFNGAFPLDVRGNRLSISAMPEGYSGQQKPFGVVLFEAEIAENQSSGTNVVYDCTKINDYSLTANR